MITKYQLATIAKDGVDYSFIVNSNGTIQHPKSTEYKEDGDVLIATGIKNASGKATETKFVENGQFKLQSAMKLTTGILYLRMLLTLI